MIAPPLLTKPGRTLAKRPHFSLVMPAFKPNSPCVSRPPSWLVAPTPGSGKKFISESKPIQRRKLKPKFSPRPELFTRHSKQSTHSALADRLDQGRVFYSSEAPASRDWSCAGRLAFLRPPGRACERWPVFHFCLSSPHRLPAAARLASWRTASVRRSLSPGLRGSDERIEVSFQITREEEREYPRLLEKARADQK